MTLEDTCRQLIRKKIPNLSPFGFDYFPVQFSDDDIKAVRLCMAWIKVHTRPLKTIRSEGSYGLKHMVERKMNFYIPNGAFIAAALILGYKYERNGPNARFNFKVTDKNPWGY